MALYDIVEDVFEYLQTVRAADWDDIWEEAEAIAPLLDGEWTVRWPNGTEQTVTWDDEVCGFLIDGSGPFSYYEIKSELRGKRVVR